MGIFKRRPRADSCPVDVPDDIGEAREVRAQASEAHKNTLLRGFDVSQLTAELAARRQLNHFGEDIAITFTRRTA